MKAHWLGWLCVGLLVVFIRCSGPVLAAEPADDPIAAPLLTAEQIEADVLQQAVVRVAAAQPATLPQATTREDAVGGCDGVIDGHFGFHTQQEEGPWWQVDLGQTLPLDRIVIYNRGDGVGGRAAHLKVLLSDNAQDWRLLYQHDGSEFHGHSDQKPLQVAAGNETARYVRIQLPDREYLHLDEVQVYRDGSPENVAWRKPADQSSASPWSTLHVEPESASPAEPAYRVEDAVERGLRLAADLESRGVDVQDAVRSLRAVGMQYGTLSESSPASERRALWLAAHRIIRQLALHNPLLDFDDLLLVKRVPGSFTHMSDQYYGWFSRPGGGLYVLEGFKTAAPRLRHLTAALPTGSVLRPDLSWDARRVLFAHCTYYPGLADEPNKLDKDNVPEDAFYHLYEMNLDGTGLRRLTTGKYDDFDGRYLPDGRIVFLSTRRGQDVQCTSDQDIAGWGAAQPDCYVRCGGGPERPVAVYTLHVLDPQAGTITRISPFEMFEWTPSVDDQGQILYARWDYVDRHNMPYMSLWSTLPDGTDARAVYGNYTQNPHCVFEARRIPGSRKIIFTASGHHAQTGGALVLLDPNRGPDGDEPITRLTPEVVFPESEGWPATYFASPYPLSEQHYLVAWSAAPLPPGTPRPFWGMPAPPNDLGLYLFDAFGNLTLLYRDPEISSSDPLPIRPRCRPPLVASRVEVDQEGAESRMLVVDVYQGLTDVPRGTIKQLRLVGIPAKTHPTMNWPQMGITQDDPGKFVIGEVPVEADGSAYFRAPPGVPFFLQALDADALAVQTMRSATYLQPGQTATCIGCHEPRNHAPANVRPLAALRAPSKIRPPVPGAWPLVYSQLVQPVLDRHCVACHRPGERGASFDLTADRSYDALVGYGHPSLQDHVWARYHEGRSTAGAGAARTNPLWNLLDRGHYDVRLDATEKARLAVWMDTYGQRSGTFDPHQEEQLQRLRQRMASMMAETPGR